MPKAKNLPDAISLFDATHPLTGTELGEFYVERTGQTLKHIETYLNSALKDNRHVKLLLGGHRGSGKSTALSYLSQEIKHRFFIVTVDLINFAPSLFALSYQDILLGMALALTRRAAEKGVFRQSPAAWLEENRNKAFDFVREKLALPPGLPGDLPIKPEEVSAKLNAGVAELEFKYKITSRTRSEAADYVEKHPDEILQHINELAQAVGEKESRQVLFIVENTDKPDIARARDIFQGHASLLTVFNASAIYTFPIGLVYSVEFSQFRSFYTRHFVLPNFQLNYRDGAPTPEVEAALPLRQIVLKRLAENCIEQAALNVLVNYSGGLLVQLIRTTQSAIINAVSRNATVVESPDALAAVRQEEADFIRQLRPEDYRVLRDRAADKTISSQPEVQQLLHGLALLEYNGDGPWCDVNPAIRDEVARRAP